MRFSLNSDARFALSFAAAEEFGLSPRHDDNHRILCRHCRIAAVDVVDGQAAIVFPDNGELSGASMPIEAIDLDMTTQLHGHAAFTLFSAIMVELAFERGVTDLEIHFAEWAVIAGRKYDAIAYDDDLGELVLRRKSPGSHKTWDSIDEIECEIGDITELLAEMSDALVAITADSDADAA